MKLSLIGMSGAGKSRLSNRLAEAGFQVFGCDTLIGERLQEDPSFPEVLSGQKITEALAKWLGKPHHKRYPERAKQYLTLEANVTRQAIRDARYVDDDQDVVIDTSGSLVHLAPVLRSNLKRVTRVVHLDVAGLADIEQTIRDKMAKGTKPIIWGDAYVPREGEAPRETRARCAPDLIDFRDAQYRALANVTLNAAEVRATSLEDTLAKISGV